MDSQRDTVDVCRKALWGHSETAERGRRASDPELSQEPRELNVCCLTLLVCSILLGSPNKLTQCERLFLVLLKLHPVA